MSEVPWIEGVWVDLEGAHEGNWRDIAAVDQERKGLAELGGWFMRPVPATPWSTMLIRSRDDGRPLGVIDAMPLPGYPGVVNVSIYVCAEGRRVGRAFDAYFTYVTYLFTQGVRLVHHEVLAFNRPIVRMLRAIDLEPSARLREHGYAAGRLWDVLVYSYDRAHWDTVRTRFSRRRGHSPVSA